MIDDDTFKNFSKYLFDLGFLNDSTLNEFSKKYEEISQRKMYISSIEPTNSTLSGINKNNIIDTFVEFYKSLQEERKKLLAVNVFNKFIKKGEKKNMKESENNEIQLSNLDDIIMEKDENNKDDTNKIIEHVESFNIPGIKNNKEQNEEKNDGCSFSNFINKKKAKKVVAKNNFSYQKPKKAEKNDQKIVLNEECTFQPNADKIKNKPLSKDQQDQLLKRLYTKDNEEKKKKLIEDIRSQQDKENIFQPNFHKTKYNLSRKNFDERLRHFQQVRYEKESNRLREEEKQFKERFPFAPKRKNSISSRRNNSASRSNNNIYQKLYEDNARKMARQNQNLNKIINEIKDRANHPITTHNNIDYIKRMKFERYERLKMYPGNMYNMNNRNNRNNINAIKNKEAKKSYEFNRIEELYKEYKKIKEEMNSRKKTENNENYYNEQNSIDDNGNILNDAENYDYNNNIENNYMNEDNNNKIDYKFFNDGNIDNNNSKEANIDNNNIEENDDFDNDNDNDSKEENIDNNIVDNNYDNSVEHNNEDINNKSNKEKNNEDNEEEGQKDNNYNDNEQENGGDNENSINQNYEYADKASVKNEEENENEIQNN